MTVTVREPKVQIRWSDDGGYTWSNWINRSIGTTGQFNKQVQFWRLGQGRNRVFQLRYTEPTPFKLMGARLEITKGNS